MDRWQRHEEVGMEVQLRARKTFRQNADDDKLGTGQENARADDGRICLKVTLPQPVADDRHVRVPSLVVCAEAPTESRHDVEYRKEVSAHRPSADVLTDLDW